MPDYPHELEDVVMTALETDPDDRFQDTDAMRRALEMTAAHLGLSLGGSSVSRVLSDVCGTRAEPWLQVAGVEEITAVDSESAPILGTLPAAPGTSPAPPTHGPELLLAPGAPRLQPRERVVLLEPDDAKTARFMTVDSEPPQVITHSLPPIPPAPIPPKLPPPLPARTASGSTPPPTPRAATVPLRVTPPPRPAPTLPDDEPPTPPLQTARGTMSELTPLVDLRTSKHAARIALAIGLGIFAVGIVAMLAAGGESAPAPVEDAPATAARSVPSKDVKPAPPPPPPANARTKKKADADADAPPKVDTPAPAPESTPGFVTVRVTSEPDNATVVLDGVKLGKTPFVGTIKIGREGALKVRKSGYLTHRREVRFDEDLTWDIHLRRRR
jgi:hypothetical protein